MLAWLGLRQSFRREMMLRTGQFLEFALHANSDLRNARAVARILLVPKASMAFAVMGLILI